MPQATFSSSTPKIKPPAYCITKKIPFLPIIPGQPPPQLQAYARWTDMDPLIPLDIAWYCTLPRRGSDWYWSGSVTKYGITCQTSIERIATPNNWTVTITIKDYYVGAESHAWPAIQFTPDWDTRPLETIFIMQPHWDFRRARVTM